MLSQIFAKQSVPHEARPRSKKVFVGGLAPETTNGKEKEMEKRRKKDKEGEIEEKNDEKKTRSHSACGNTLLPPSSLSLSLPLPLSLSL